MRVGRLTNASRSVAWRVWATCTALLLGACYEPLGDGNGRAAIVWRDVSNALTRPALVDSLAVFGTYDGRVVAYQRETGSVVWSRRLSNDFWGRELTYVAGHIIVPEYELWALSPVNGATQWRYPGPDGLAGAIEPTIVGDTLFIGTGGGWAVALNAQTGTELWRTDLEEAAFQPAVGNDLVVFGTRSFLGAGPREGPLGAGHVIALRRSDGSEAWRFAIPDSAGFPVSGGAVNGGVIWQDRVIVGSRSARIYALRLSDGALLWERTGGSPGSAYYGTRPTVLGETAMMLRGDGLLEARSAATGDVVWSRSIGTNAAADPVVRNGMVYAVGLSIWAFTEGGSVVWRWGGWPDGQPTFSSEPAFGENGLLYMIGSEPDVLELIAYAFRPPRQ